MIDFILLKCDYNYMEKDEILYKFGRSLAKVRKNKGLTQEDICEKTTFMKNTVSELERGKADSRFLTIYGYAKAADISLTEVFYNFEKLSSIKSPKLQEIIDLLYHEDDATLEVFYAQAKLLLSAIKKK